MRVFLVKLRMSSPERLEYLPEGLTILPSVGRQTHGRQGKCE